MVIFLTPLSINSISKRIDRPRFFGLYSYWESRSSILFTFLSTKGFCPFWVSFRTTALRFDSYTAPVKLPAWHCYWRESYHVLYIVFQYIKNQLNDISLNQLSKESTKVEVFHCRLRSLLYYTSCDSSQSQTRVKLNRVFFPRSIYQARSLGCDFAR